MTSVELTISDVLCTAGQSGFFFDDQMAIRRGAPHEGFDYDGAPATEGFSRIRQPGESVSVMLLLSNGDVAIGDCVTVQYPGAGGRDPLFHSADVIATIDAHVRPLLIGAPLDSFRTLATQVDGHVVDGRPMPSAIRYGATQAILDGVARSKRRTMAEVIRDEYDTGVVIAPVAMFAQSGDDRYANVEKMILKEVDVMPHGLINDVVTKVGRDGEIFRDFVRWVHDRILALRSRPDYSPLLHFDCYGTIGEAFHGDPVGIASYLADLEDVAAPFQLRLEHPLDAGGRDAQIVAMARLRSELKERSINVQIVVDEWCNTLEDIEAFVTGESADVIHVKMPDLGGINNTIEALLYVRAHGLRAYCGGSCTETDVSARVSANVAMACGADQILAKPGMGVDEGLQIVGNEMTRVTALVGLRERGGGGTTAT
ncbi:MAG TPA: methylaspartate ammonia-lyase [Acidimicrobiales bacterium]|nr:methylaspartate ammonia-lyase [Acidimicrobiales bacterium]